jgi:phosphate transport system substrate-binding protein
MYANRKNNDMAVSPIVATLVLIVVAVIGAVAVGTIMGTFSTDVSKKANTGDIGSASATEILIAGSTTVQPASENLAKEYMKENPSIKINVQGGGSGAGVSSVGMGIVDIGASSELSKITDAIATGKEEYVDLKYYQVGGSAVVFVSKDTTITTVDFPDVNAAYAEATAGTGTTAAHGLIPIGTVMYQRQESSGTEEAVAKALTTYASAKSLDASNAKQVQGNQGMLDAIKGSTTGFGFLDWGYASTSGLNLVTVTGSGAPTATSIKASLKAMTATDKPTQTTSMYNVTLSRGLYYATKGEPNSVVKSFITYAQSPEGAVQIQKAGMFGISDFAL